MNDADRIERVVELLKFVWQDRPSLRLGQLMSYLTEGDLFYMRDEHMEKKLREVLRDEQF